MAIKSDSSNNENYESLTNKGKRLEALIRLSNEIYEKEQRRPIPFNDFLYLASQKPQAVFRDVFQLFHDMVKYYIPDGVDEYENSQDSVGFKMYDCSRLFRESCDDPFFADRLFANRFIDLVEGFRKGVQNNRIYLFEGPAGSGKSTFLNNVLKKLEDYTKMPEGRMYKTYWRLDVQKLGGYSLIEEKLKKIAQYSGDKNIGKELLQTSFENKYAKRYLDISCPSNDHPILQIPKSFRKKFLDELITDVAFKEKLFSDKQYNWIFKDEPCSICNSIYNVLYEEIGDPIEIYNMLNARRTDYNRQFGKGVSVFNPGDSRMVKPMSNRILQSQINELLGTEDIKYLYSDLANTNNGVFALMDVKEHNIDRLKSLHGIISDGVHKVEQIEERIKSLFVGLINPEDKRHYENIKSFQDRIITVKIPYVLDYRTEVAIYKNKFGNSIATDFLPRVLDNFSKIIISTRLNRHSPTIKDWINTTKYSKHLDSNALLLKMDVYTGIIPDWLSEEDVKKFTKPIRKKLLLESENEGYNGISGRKSISAFNVFYSKYYSKEKPITMDMVKQFFEDNNEFKNHIPTQFVSSLENMYDYNVLQEVKESVYFYSKKQISKDIQNYIYAINFEKGETINCAYTNDIIDVSEDYFKNFEAIYLGTTSTLKERQAFRKDVLTEYITVTLAQDIRLKNKKIENTELFNSLYERYIRHHKENALAPYIDNKNFRRAILDYNTEDFNKYDTRLKYDVKRLLDNLQKQFDYTLDGAQHVSIYVLDKDLAKKFV